MRFHELPNRLRVYIAAHALLLAPLVFVLHQPRPDRTHPLDLCLLLLATVIFSTWKVELTVFQGRMTLAFAVICLAQLLQGLPVAILCAGAGALAGTLLRPTERRGRVQVLRPPLYRLGFNVGNCVLACLLASVAYEAVKGHGPDTGLAPILSLIVFTAIYFAVNTLGVSIAIALQQKLPWTTVWEQNFLWTAPGYFASASAAMGIDAAYGQFHVGSLLFLPPLYLIYSSYRLYMDRLHLYSDKMERDMAHIQELNQLNQAVIASLAAAIDAKDSVTCSHINRVRHYATALAQSAGVSGPELEAVATGALVHDIGKLGIPDHILSKPGKLAPEEFVRIQSHVAIGTEILSPIPFPFPVVDVVRTHHERWDGLGYPYGLKGEEIPIGGRIISIVDVFDALTSDRPYRRALSMESALNVLQEGAGKQFDPKLVLLFESVLPDARAEIDRMEAEQQERMAAESTPKEGASALAQINQAAAEMAAVAEVAHALADQETLVQISRVVVDRAMALLPADTAVLYLRGSNEEELVAAVVEGKYRDKLEGMTIQMGEGAAGWVARSGQPRVNVSAALDVARRFTPEETLELSAATVVPLTGCRVTAVEAAVAVGAPAAGDGAGSGPSAAAASDSQHPAADSLDTLGALAVYTTGYSVMTGHHLNVLNILAEHAAAAIQNSQRFERQREMAYTDPLTGLANSRSLVRHLERLTYSEPGVQAIRRSGDQGQQSDDPNARTPECLNACFGILMMDLDHFKEVNDTLGHLEGDELLRRVAERLTSVARPGDVVCRYAGDEFVMLLAGADFPEAGRVAERARAAIDGLPMVSGQVKISASVGVASYPADGPDGRTLLNVADKRMYEDKFQRRRALRLPSNEAVLELVEGD
jgi:diguanylate cyclase (GGDEF)-like protein/putative nucleotidyltransferase with HDIG domain